MKKMNLLVMSLVSAAALSFTSCSDSEDLAGNSQNVDGFYITLNVQTPKANGTRTSQTDRKTENATDDEAKVTTGTFYLYDGNTCVFQKKITKDDWKKATSKDNNEGVTKAIKVSVNGVTEGKKYQVYFLAGNETSSNPISDTFTATYTGTNSSLATAGSFVMFNQNDKQRKLGGDKRLQ